MQTCSECKTVFGEREMSKLEKLTQNQEALTSVVSDEWIRIAHSGKDLTIDEIQDDINWIYNKCNLKPPTIIIFDSFLAHKVGTWLITQSGLNSVRNSVWNSVRNSVENSVEGFLCGDD